MTDDVLLGVEMRIDLHSDTMSSTQSPSPELYRATTWHPHQYSIPSNVPTSFTIKDILAWGTEEEEEECFKGEEEEKVEEDCPVSPSPPTTPSPQPLSMEVDDDEPLNLTVAKRATDSPSSSAASLTDETNNNRLVNGRLYHHSISRDKSPPNLLPNEVIIPKVKHPKSFPATTKNGTAKSKGCGAINLKTGTKRKVKQGSGGGPSPKVLVIDTTSNRPDTATTPLARVLSPGLENGSSNDSKKRKKARTTFTGKQIYELERQFEIKKYLSSSERSEMARLLNVTEVQVKIWFQNRRTKWKKQDNISNAEAAEHKVMSTKSSKKEKNGSSNQSKGSSSSSKRKSNSSGGRLPGTSECSLSISGSMDSSDDHSNASHLTDGTSCEEPNLSAEYNKQPKDFSHKLPPNNQNTITTTVPNNSVLLSQLSNQPSTQGLLHLPLHSFEESEIRGGRSPPITIPRLPFMNLFSTLPNKSSVLFKAEPVLSPQDNSELIISHSKLSSPSIEEDLSESDKPGSDNLPNNLVVSMCSSLGDEGDEGGHSDDESQLISVNKSSENMENFSPVSQTS